MKTIYFYPYAARLLGCILAAAIFLFAFVMAIVAFWYLKPVCKVVYAWITKTLKDKFPDITPKLIIANIVTCSLLYLILILAMFFTGKAIIQDDVWRIERDLSKCQSVYGVDSDFKCVEELYNHGDDVVYCCSFEIAGERFEDVKFEQYEMDYLNYFQKDNLFKVYYSNVDGQKVVVRIDVDVEASSQ